MEAGAKIDETDNDGKSAIMLAAQEGHTSLVERLLKQHSAPIDQHAHDGKTALRYCADDNNDSTVHFTTFKLIQFSTNRQRATIIFQTVI